LANFGRWDEEDAKKIDEYAKTLYEQWPVGTEMLDNSK
jgi:uncharacterized membrane protein YgcG